MFLAGGTSYLSMYSLQVSFVEQQVVKTRVKRDHEFVYSSPTDGMWHSQWYLVSMVRVCTYCGCP